MCGMSAWERSVITIKHMEPSKDRDLLNKRHRPRRRVETSTGENSPIIDAVQIVYVLILNTQCMITAAYGHHFQVSPYIPI